MLEIIYQDQYLVVINKPHGLLVHRSSIAADAEEFALQMVRDQIGKTVYPVHRLDRKTSGILVFALNSRVAARLKTIFENPETQKTYIAIVRGYFPDAIVVDYALTNDRGKTQDAITHFKTIRRSELHIPFGKFDTSRYSLIEAYPKTGRMHQIRKHLNHLRHPIIGDRPHGCNKQNRLFKERWNMTTMLLHARQLEFEHPITNEMLVLKAEPFEEFKRMLNVLELN
ncbi:pseudouridylate synthase [Carboxylicivirga sediminis]|uniref:tRNA pseudouridine synthase C n=1 Tax=Carboxylicivirga sediminis TaxID=2006564 RepID=A0A941IZM1_9BACT|nr:pseudouridine synthase [Carboxylicivirga sediminis]MBR8537449.1 pseudouridylate synthase [Carboxylicivirga sediminis]